MYLTISGTGGSWCCLSPGSRLLFVLEWYQAVIFNVQPANNISAVSKMKVKVELV